MRLKIIVLLVLFIGCNEDDMQFAQHGVLGSANQGQQISPTDDFVPVIFSWGQSNEIGRAEYYRYLDLTPYTFDPTKVSIYTKTDYTATDNGSWGYLQVGSPSTHEYDLPTFVTYGSYVTAAIKLSAILNRRVYIIPTADGGTVVNTLGTYRTWNPATSNECFDVAMDNYYQVAIDKLQAANPGVPIVVFITVTEGETDAGQSRSQADFYADITSVISAMRSYEQLSSSLLVAAKINYMQTAAETTINAAWEQYRAANSTLTRLIETSDLKRKQDLTAAEKGGITVTASDDEHLSYLAQNTKGLRVAEAIRAYYGWPDVSLTPASTNTGYNPTGIGTVHVRIQGTSGKVTLTTNKYQIATITNDGSIGSFSITNGVLQYKEDGFKGWINSDKNKVVGGATDNLLRVQSSAAIGTSLFNHSFSFAAWVRPRDGNPPAIYTLFHDIQNTASVNNSRVTVVITTDGKIYAYYAVGGTVVQAQTNTAIFSDNTQEAPKHIAVTFTSGDLIRIYVDGVLQTLDVTLNGNLSTVVMANYVNATNVMTIGATRSGASTYTTHFYGHIREFMIQPVVYSAGDIANLMLN